MAEKKTEKIEKKTEKKPEKKTSAKITKKLSEKIGKKKPDKEIKKDIKVKIIPLGGLGEIGKNMMAIEVGEEIFIIDCGLSFPEEDMLGIDIVIPDMTYIFQNKDRVKAVLVTHGHEDHIGGLPYLLRDLRVPVYGTRLTLGLLKGKLKEHVWANDIPEELFHEIAPLSKHQVGSLKVEFFRVNHSIADAVGLALHTPLGIIIHTGDFKFDQTPVDGERVDIHKIAELGQKNVLLLMSDSTNAERPGYTKSESSVGDTIRDIFSKSKERIIVATFSSNVHRLQQIIDAAAAIGRKVAVVGRSMNNVVDISMELGYLKVDDNVLIDIDKANRLENSKVVIITTGSQGEPMSALTRMSMNMHKKLSVMPGDTVMISATPVPGNEKMVSRTINNLFKEGANVVYDRQSGVHASGHGSQEELKLMLNLIRPKYFMPVHGEYRHLMHHKMLAEELGILKENIFIMENGQILELSEGKAEINGKVTAGQTLIDGLGIGDVGNIVLRDRKLLSEDGIVIVVVTIDSEVNILAGPEIVSRGFVYVRESEELIENVRNIAANVLEKCAKDKNSEWSAMKNMIKQEVGSYLYEQTRRKPVILSIIMEI